MSLTSNDLSPTKRKIIGFFRNNWEDCYSPKMVAQKLNLNYNTVKSYTNQLSKDGYLLRLQKGLYQWGGRLTPKQIKRLIAEHVPLFHAIQYVIMGGEGVRMTLPKNPFKILGMDDTCRSVDWQNEKNEIYCTIGCTDNCLSPLETISFNTWLIGYFKGCKIEIRNIGINRDLPNIKLEGMQCVTIQEFNNVLYRAYNKGNFLRIEHHYSGYVNLMDILMIEKEFLKLLLEAHNKNRPVPRQK